MFHLLFLGAILLANLVNAKLNLTCYQCSSCSSTPINVSVNNQLCLRIQVNCIAADIHMIDLTGDRLHSNHSVVNCGQTLLYSSACTIAYHCCYKDRCNTYDALTLSSSSLSLFTSKRIIMSVYLLFIYHYFLS